MRRLHSACNQQLPRLNSYSLTLDSEMDYGQFVNYVANRVANERSTYYCSLAPSYVKKSMVGADTNSFLGEPVIEHYFGDGFPQTSQWLAAAQEHH